MLWFILGLGMIYLFCMFLNAIFSAAIEETYNIDVPVNVICYLGFIGTFVLFVTWCLLMDDPWSRKNTIFYRLYRAAKD